MAVGTPCLGSGILAPALLSSCWGHLCAIGALRWLMEVSFWNRGLPLVLWLWHWNTAVCKRQYIIAPGCPLCSSLFILGKFLCFPGDGACVTLAPASVVSEGPQACFVVQVSKGGWGAWEFPAGAVTTQCQNRYHVTLLCHIFFGRLVFVVLLKSGFTHQTEIMKSMNNVLPSEMCYHLNFYRVRAYLKHFRAHVPLDLIT